MNTCGVAENEFIQELKIMKKVSYLGPEGSWSDLCSKLWVPDYVSVPCKSMEEALEKAETGSSDICVIPVENSTEGPVPQVLDMLTDSPLNIVGERIMNIRHSLMSNSREIKIVYSHQQAIAQCRKTIRRLYPDAVVTPVSSTSEKWMEAAGEKGVAIIGSPWVSRKYGIKIINSDISDYPVNLTRFIGLGNSLIRGNGRSKASLSFSLPNDGPGSLVSALKPLSDRKINLSMVVSRPDKNSPGSYRFFIDCIEFPSVENLEEAVEEMKKMGAIVSLKGIYERSSWADPDY